MSNYECVICNEILTGDEILSTDKRDIKLCKNHLCQCYHNYKQSAYSWAIICPFCEKNVICRGCKMPLHIENKESINICEYCYNAIEKYKIYAEIW
jgi:hypothetical protein